jgi:hypothetical protein
MKRSNCLEMAASWCNPSDGLDYTEYLDQIRRSINNGFINPKCFMDNLKLALQNTSFSWRGLLIDSKAVNPTDFPEIVLTQESSKEYVLEYFMPIFEELGGELGLPKPVA